MLLGHCTFGTFITDSDDIDVFSIEEDFSELFKSLYQDKINQFISNSQYLPNYLTDFNFNIKGFSDSNFDYQELTFGIIAPYEYRFPIFVVNEFNDLYNFIVQDLLDENSELAKQLWNNPDFLFIKERIKESPHMNVMTSIADC